MTASRRPSFSYVFARLHCTVANTYGELGRLEDSLRMRREVYSGKLRLYGAESERTVFEANNYATTLARLQRFEEAQALFRKTIPSARRVLGENNALTLEMTANYARTVYGGTASTLDDLREALTTLEDTERTARRVLGGAHPITKGIEHDLRLYRDALNARKE